MQQTLKPFVDSEAEALRASSDDEDLMEPITQAQNKYNELQERYIALKTMTESLKERISLEREQWKKEVKATVEMEAQLREGTMHMCGDICATNREEYRKKMQLFREFMLFKSNTEQLDKLMKRRNYESWISEVENKCQLELLRIKENMITLKPLQDIASRWDKENQEDRICVSGASGDTLEDGTEIVPVKETSYLEIDES